MTEKIILFYLILFAVGSVIGWIGEFIYRNITRKNGTLCNPGLCSGPCLPIYGVGFCLIYFVCSEITSGGEVHPLIVCLVLTVLLTILEFIVGTATLNLLHIRLWDYRDMPFNLNGIICPFFSAAWGVIACIYYFLIHEHVEPCVSNIIDWTWTKFFLGMFFGIFAVDLAHSLGIAAKLRKLTSENNITIHYEKLKRNLRAYSEKGFSKFFIPLRSTDIGKINLSDAFSSFISLAQHEKEEFIARLSENDLKAWYIETETGEKLISLKHILLYIPAYIAVYFITSKGIPITSCHEVYCYIDEALAIIPAFSVPYVSWLFLVPFMCFYLLKTDITGFRRFAKYLMMTSMLSVFTFIIYPSCMPLRPSSVEVNSVATFILNTVYFVDSNTNVCPSVHVIWAIGMLFAVWNDKKFSSPVWKAVWTCQVILICVSTFMIKQHSVIDSAVAVPYIIVGWLSSYKKAKHSTLKTASAE